VCGSTEHPAPVASLAVVPTEGEIERAQAAYDEAQDLRERRTGEVESRRSELDQLIEAAGDAPAAALAAELAEAREEFEAAMARAAEAERLEAVLHRHERELDLARDEHDRVSRRLAENRARDENLAAERARLAAELD